MSEGGNYDQWHYSAEYTEFLLYLPFIHNFADAHFSVKPGGEGVYIIQSTHNTCFFTRFLCCMYAGVQHIDDLHRVLEMNVYCGVNVI